MTLHASPLFRSIRETAHLLRAGELSSRELTEASLERIEAIAPTLNAFVTAPAEPALAGAAMAARKLASGSAHPLCGVPVAVKDIVDVEGLPTRCGSLTRADAAPATADATVVRRLRDAGAVIIGKAVTQEFAAGTLSPPARNPWAPDRVPGGSSGGSAVAVATGAAMSAIGSDTGGSIRNPAALCGVVGLKPTFGVLPTTGVFPLSWALDTVGPIARTVDDAWLTFLGMAGRSDDDAPLERDLRGLRIGLLGGYFRERVDPETVTAVERSALAFRSLGIEVIEVDWAAAATARASAFLINRIETLAVHADMLNARRTDLDLLNPSLRLRLVAGQFIPADAYVQAQRTRLLMRESAAELFRAHRLDAVVAPVAATTAVPAADPVAHWADGPEDAGSAYTRLTQPFNATGQPAIAVPCGFDRSGLPIGMQIVGRPNAERSVCEIAHGYEQATDWHRRRPPLLDSLGGGE